MGYGSAMPTEKTKSRVHSVCKYVVAAKTLPISYALMYCAGSTQQKTIVMGL